MTRFTRLVATNVIAAIATTAVVCAVVGLGAVWAAFVGGGL